LEPKLHSFLHITADRALEQAKQVDAKIAAGEPIGLLAGIPISRDSAVCPHIRKIPQSLRLWNQRV